MRSFFLYIAAMASFAPTVVMSQVIADIDNIITAVRDGSQDTAQFMAISGNSGNIDASVTVISVGSDATTKHYAISEDSEHNHSAFFTTRTVANTQVTLGDISTLAAGAVNDVSLNLNLYEGVIGSGNGSLTGTTLPAVASTDRSYSVEGLTLSSNEANVSGTVTVVTNSSQSEIGGIDTTTVGSMNNSSVTLYIGR